MDERLLRILNGKESLYPKVLEEKFPRVFGRLMELWDSPEIEHYFTDLMMDSRGGTRQGFPREVASEIFTLSMVHAKLRELKQQATASAYAWDEVDNPKRVALEQRGYDYSPKGFIHSAEKNDRDAVALFLGSGADVDACDERGWTPLMVSSFNGNEEIALLLIRSGADVHARDKAGYGPLHWAAFNGYTKVVGLLLEKRADANARSNHGWTPLLQAATRGHLLACAQLIAGNADVNLASNDGWTPLHKACANGHAEVVKLLLSKGAKRNVEYQDGTTPLALASKNKHEAIVALLTTPR